METILGYSITNVEILWHIEVVEVTITELCIELVGPECAEYIPKTLNMLVKSLAKYQNIAKVYDYIFATTQPL